MHKIMCIIFPSIKIICSNMFVIKFWLRYRCNSIAVRSKLKPKE